MSIQPKPVEFGYLGLSNSDRYYLDRPDPNLLTPDFIARTLCKLCRFGGHIEGFDIYSVAQHSVLVSHLVPTEFAFEGLMHDATEAICADVPKPIKQRLSEYEGIEQSVWNTLRKRYDLPATMSPEVHLADCRAVISEARDFTSGDDWKTWYPDIEPLYGKLEIESPFEAYHSFLARFNEITERHPCLILA